MVKSIQELEREKKRLLLREKASKILIDLTRHKKLKRQKLEAEVRALKNPGSQSAKNTVRRLTRRTGKILFKNAVKLGRHLSTVAAEQNQPDRKKSKKSRRRK